MNFNIEQEPDIVKEMVKEMRLITATARIPEEHLEAWREWVKAHDGNVVVPREKEDKDGKDSDTNY